MATISSPRNEPNVSTFCKCAGKCRLEVVEDGVGVERDGWASVACGPDEVGHTRDVGKPPCGEVVVARCRGDDSPPATTHQITQLEGVVVVYP